MIQFMARRKPNQQDLTLPQLLLAVAGVLVGGGAGWVATKPAPEQVSMAADVAAQAERGVAILQPEPRPYRRFSGCNDARAAGYENISINEPSYRADWDGDGDGIACEPHR